MRNGGDAGEHHWRALPAFRVGRQTSWTSVSFQGHIYVDFGVQCGSPQRFDLHSVSFLLLGASFFFWLIDGRAWIG